MPDKIVNPRRLQQAAQEKNSASDTSSSKNTGGNDSPKMTITGSKLITFPYCSLRRGKTHLAIHILFTF